MKKWILLLLITLTSTIIFSQEKNKTIEGFIGYENHPLKDVHILNKTSQIGTITNDGGKFKIVVNENDTLLVSHLNFKNQEILITHKIIKERAIIISMKDETYVLDEVSISKPKSIFHIDKDIMPHNAPIVNAKTLKLPYANSKPKKDERIVKLNSGFAISLTNLITTLNGSKKRARKANELYKQDKNLQKIRKHFTDDFFVTDLKIKKQYINQFLNYCASKNIIRHYQSDNQLRLIKVLLEESKTFAHQIDSDDKLFTKK